MQRPRDLNLKRNYTGLLRANPWRFSCFCCWGSVVTGAHSPWALPRRAAFHPLLFPVRPSRNRDPRLPTFAVRPSLLPSSSRIEFFSSSLRFSHTRFPCLPHPPTHSPLTCLAIGPVPFFPWCERLWPSRRVPANPPPPQHPHLHPVSSLRGTPTSSTFVVPLSALGCAIVCAVQHDLQTCSLHPPHPSFAAVPTPTGPPVPSPAPLPHLRCIYLWQPAPTRAPEPWSNATQVIFPWTDPLRDHNKQPAPILDLRPTVDSTTDTHGPTLFG